MRRVGAGLLAVLLVALVLSGCRAQRTVPAFDFTLEQKGESLVVRVETGTFKIGKDGHIHIRMDDGPEAMAYGATYTIPKVQPGKHTITLGLSDPQHNPIGENKTKEIEIK